MNFNRQHIQPVIHVEHDRVFVQLRFVPADDFAQRCGFGIHESVRHVASHDLNPVEVDHSAVIAAQAQQALHS